jgi:hypothetical protein
VREAIPATTRQEVQTDDHNSIYRHVQEREVDEWRGERKGTREVPGDMWAKHLA